MPTNASESNDADLLRFYSQCFDRPAFHDPFMEEGSMEAFDKAIATGVKRWMLLLIYCVRYVLDTGSLCGQDESISAVSIKDVNFITYEIEKSLNGWIALGVKQFNYFLKCVRKLVYLNFIFPEVGEEEWATGDKQRAKIVLATVSRTLQIYRERFSVK